MNKYLKNIVVSVFIIGILSACSSDDNEPTDNTLIGTEWSLEYMESPSNIVSEDSIFLSFELVIHSFPLLRYTKSTIEKNTILVLDGYRNYYNKTLLFENSRCTYTSLTHSIGRIEEQVAEYTRYTILDQECQGLNGSDMLIVKNNRVYIYPIGSPEDSTLILKLEDNNLDQLNRKISSDIRLDSILIEKNVEKLNYTRTENEVILYNADVKFVGNLDKCNWTIDLTQILPSNKALGSFQLKK